MQLRIRLNGDNANSVALLMMGELQPLNSCLLQAQKVDCNLPSVTERRASASMRAGEFQSNWVQWARCLKCFVLHLLHTHDM